MKNISMNKIIKGKYKIIFYKQNGEISDIKELTNDNLERINGMMTRCTLEDESEMVGFADPFRTCDRNSYDGKVHDNIFLWTWDNLDEENHKLIGDENNKYNQTFKKVIIDEIIKVESILYSNPRWGGKLTNKFSIK